MGLGVYVIDNFQDLVYIRDDDSGKINFLEEAHISKNLE